ncbi:MAG: ABC transporter substrate-binding protein [Candidatus Krumholzibacteriia bacterium]
MKTSNAARHVVLVLAATASGVLLCLGCATTGGTRLGDRALSLAQGDSLYAAITAAYAAGDFDTVDRSARKLIYSLPDYARSDEVLLTAATASRAAGDPVQAVKYAAMIPEKYPLSPYREEALFLTAAAYQDLGKYYESAGALSAVLASPIDPDMEHRALAALNDVTRDLALPDLERLVKEYPASPLAGEISLGIAKQEFLRGNYDRAYKLLANLLYEFPQHKRAPEVRQLLQLAASHRDDPARRIEYLEPDRIGLVLPRTGNLARFGRYFEQGAKLAVDDYNAAAGAQVSIVSADSKGNPVDAVGAVRKLVVEEGVLSILGAVSSVSSIAAAIECNAWKVPMLSPVVSEQRIEEVGTWVFHTKVSAEVEVSAMAKVAREDLLLERFAVLAPSSPERRKLAEYFVQEVLNRGGELVAEEYYEDGATDFKEQLETIREAAPDALFIPGEVEELILALPQVSFYDMQVQLLGLSNWNTEKLLRLSQRELEGALFPREAHHGRDRESHQLFRTRYKEAFGVEAHPVAASAYFGTRFLLQALQAGAADRDQVRNYLNTELHASAAQRMTAANSLSILKVTSGKVREFTAFLR